MKSIYIEQKDGVSVLNIKGRVDASVSAQIHEKIMDEIESGCSKMVIDFSDVNYISSAGLRVMIYASKALTKKSGAFSICALNKNIEKIFEVSGLSTLFSIHETLDSSLASMQ